MQHIKPRGLQCRAIVPNSSARRFSGGVFRLFGFSPEGDTSLPVCIGQSRLLPQASNQGRSGESKRPELCLFRIGCSAPGASHLALILGELRAFAVSLGSLWIARFDGILTSLHLLGDCGWAQGNAKAAAGVANRRVEPVPGRSPTIECKVAPTAASAHTVRAIFWSSRIADGTLGVFTMPVVAPLPDVPVHVV